jgi:glycosyltransferase involved in cell wall biosynthesis
VIARGSAQYIPELRAFDAPIVFSEFGQFALYGLDVETAPSLGADAFTADSPGGANDLSLIESHEADFIPSIGGFPSDASPAGDCAQTLVLTNRLVSAKRTEVAVQAASLADIELEILGHGPEEDQLLRLIQSLDLEQHVRLHGLATREQIKSALDSSDGYILCSLPLIDGTPTAILEAMSRARAVVSYPFDGLRALVDDGREGLYFDGTPRSLADAIGRLISEPGLARRLGLNARTRWAREFSRGALLARYEKIYRDVLANVS